MKLNNVKCKALHLGRNSSRRQYMLVAEQLDTRLIMNQQRALAAKKANGCIKDWSTSHMRKGCDSRNSLP